MHRFICWIFVVAMAFSAGCTSVTKDLKKKLPWSPEAKIKTSKFETPAHMIAIWSPDILTQTGKPPTRGFGGRIYFYNEKNKAVPVEGQLVVYGYDDSNNPHARGEPQRKFAFTPDQFAKHQSSSDLGPSYSVWVPWDAAGGEQRSISLVPVFTSTSGKIVMGQQAINLLPGTPTSASPDPMIDQQPPLLSARGPTSLENNLPAESQEGVRAAAFGQSTTSLPNVERLRTSTIHLTPSLQKRLAQGRDGFVDQNVRPEESKPAAQPTFPRQPELPVYPAITAPPAEVLNSPMQDQRPVHFERSRFPVRGALNERSALPAPWTPPYPAAPPSGLQRQSS
jgi:hypothetical protein